MPEQLAYVPSIQTWYGALAAFSGRWLRRDLAGTAGLCKDGAPTAILDEGSVVIVMTAALCKGSSQMCGASGLAMERSPLIWAMALSLPGTLLTLAVTAAWCEDGWGK